MLLADSSPRWEFRYLKTLFERDPTVSLKSVLQEADMEYAAEDKTALAHFPLNREELFAYDVLILGDLNPALLGTSTMELIRSFVRDSGGGVLMIAGTSFNPLAYRGRRSNRWCLSIWRTCRLCPSKQWRNRGFGPTSRLTDCAAREFFAWRTPSRRLSKSGAGSLNCTGSSGTRPQARHTGVCGVASRRLAVGRRPHCGDGISRGGQGPVSRDRRILAVAVPGGRPLFRSFLEPGGALFKPLAPAGP